MQQGNNNNNHFDSSEQYSLNNDEACLYSSMLELIPMQMPNDPSLHAAIYQDPVTVHQDLVPEYPKPVPEYQEPVPEYEEPVPQYIKLEVTQHSIDSNDLQTATTSVDLCTAEPEQSVQHIPGYEEFTVPPPPKKHKRRRHRRRSSEDTSSEKSFQEAVEDLLGPFDDEASRASRPIPEYDNWPGSYKFSVILPAEKSAPDGISVIHSEARNILYVRKDQSFMVTFFTTSLVPDGTKINVMGMFIQQDHVSEIVKRCDRHTLHDYEKGFTSPDHLIRCESDQVLYLKDSVSGRRRLIVPFETLQGIEHYPYVSYPFKFICSGNCYGGLNGRPFRVIFTLENGGIVIGRRSVEVKICDDPHKEIMADNKNSTAATTMQTCPQPETNKVVLNDKKRKYNLLEEPTIRKTSSEEESSGTKSFQILIPDKEMYEFLALALENYRCMPLIKQFLANCQKKKKKKE